MTPEKIVYLTIAKFDVEFLLIFHLFSFNTNGLISPQTNEKSDHVDQFAMSTINFSLQIFNPIFFY